MVFEIEYPVNLRRYGGIQAWDNREITDQLHENHLGQIEALAPGFRELVLASTYSTPLDNWRRNPSAIYGHELGGDVSGAQWYMGRMPNRSRIPGLYFSNGVWPGSLTHLATGYITACCVAEDLGVTQAGMVAPPSVRIRSPRISAGEEEGRPPWLRSSTQ